MKKTTNESKRYALKLDTNLSIDIPEPNEQDDVLDFCCRQIGCSRAEIVRPKGLPKGVVMVVDEEGLFVERPTVNFIGSYLYETHKHGSPIVGIAVILAEKQTMDGAELAFLEESQAMVLAAKFSELAVAAYVSVGNELEKAGRMAH